jgi:hypothetical protein
MGCTRPFMCEKHHQELQTLGLAKCSRLLPALMVNGGSCRPARQQSTFSEFYGGWRRDVPVGFFVGDYHGSFLLLPGRERIGERPLAGCALVRQNGAAPAATSMQNNSGPPQGPADLSTGRLLVRQTACARRVPSWYGGP